MSLLKKTCPVPDSVLSNVFLFSKYVCSLVGQSADLISLYLYLLRYQT